MNTAFNRRTVLMAAALGASTTLLQACGGSDDEPQRNIVELAQNTPDLSILVEAVTAAGLANTLSTGTLTVFAPTNAAFAALLTELGVTKDALLANKPLLTAVLTYHVLGSKVMRADVPLGKAITPVSGGFFKIESNNGLKITDGRNRVSTITSTDIQASNGVVHLVDKVLLPADKDIVATASALPDFSILVEAVVAAGLVTTLQGTGPFTVFAPTNAAFAALLTELGVTKDALLANKPLLTAVLTYHVLGSKVMRADVPLGKAITPVSGGFFKIESNNGLKITDGRNRVSTITSTDIQASNGVVHLVDKVLLPADKDIVATASALPDFSILVEAVVAAGLVGTLQGTGPFTVFAPTNAAFAALLTELGVSKADLLANTALLTKVLTYHVVPARVLKAEVPTNTAITTVQGQSFTVSTSLVITDQNMRTSNITAADVFTSNGVIHVVDKVILPK